MSHIGDALRAFDCGPDCHEFGAPVAQIGSPGELEDLFLCATCMKDGRVSVCGFCDDLCEVYDEVTGPRVEGSIVVAACSYCHLDLIHQDDTEGWAFIAIAPNPPEDP